MVHGRRRRCDAKGLAPRLTSVFTIEHFLLFSTLQFDKLHLLLERVPLLDTVPAAASLRPYRLYCSKNYPVTAFTVEASQVKHVSVGVSPKHVKDTQLPASRRL